MDDLEGCTFLKYSLVLKIKKKLHPVLIIFICHNSAQSERTAIIPHRWTVRGRGTSINWS